MGGESCQTNRGCHVTQFVIGYGFGRCGTTSLARLLNIQPKSRVSHELYGLHWFNIYSKYSTIKRMFEIWGKERDFVGDVNYAWVQYIRNIVEDFPDVKFIHIWRDKEESVESFWKKSQDRRNSIDSVSPYAESTLWYTIYPYFGFPPTKDQIANNYEIFHKIAESIMFVFSQRVYTIKMENLNKEESIKKLLDFVGIPEDKQIIAKVKVNQGGQSPTDFYAIPNEEFAQKYQYHFKANITV